MFDNSISPDAFRVKFYEAVGHNDKNAVLTLARQIFDSVGPVLENAGEGVNPVEIAHVKMMAAALMAAGSEINLEKTFEKVVADEVLEMYQRDAFFSCHKLLWAEVARIGFENLVQTLAEDMRAFFAKRKARPA